MSISVHQANVTAQSKYLCQVTIKHSSLCILSHIHFKDLHRRKKNLGIFGSVIASDNNGNIILIEVYIL